MEIVQLFLTSWDAYQDNFLNIEILSLLSISIAIYKLSKSLLKSQPHRIDRRYTTNITIKLRLIIATSMLTAINFANAEETNLITFSEVKLVSPKASDHLTRALINSKQHLDNAGINTRLRMAHFLTQVMTETGGLQRIDESLNFSEQTLIRVFSRNLLSVEMASTLANNPKGTANWIYGNKFGNRGRDTDDGWNYRGSGFIKLTGRNQFDSYGSKLSKNYLESPSQLRFATEGLISAIAYWKANNINDKADSHDFYGIRKAINGTAAHGYDQSIIWFHKIWQTFTRGGKDKLGFQDDVVVLQIEDDLYLDILTNYGVNLTGEENQFSVFNGIKQFQDELGLEATGELNEETRYAILDPKEWKYRDDKEYVTPNELQIVSVLDSSEGGSAPIEPFTGEENETQNRKLTEDELDNIALGLPSIANYELGKSLISSNTKFVPYTYFEPENRIVVPTDQTSKFPARAIAFIEIDTFLGTKDNCTGFFISKDTVLTAAHCIHTGTTTGKAHKKFTVYPGLRRGVSGDKCVSEKAFVTYGWRYSDSKNIAKLHDIGAIRLDCDIGQKTGWFGIRQLEENSVGNEISFQGYMSDEFLAKGQQYYSPGVLDELITNKGFYRNDSSGNSSGSPVQITDSGTNYVVGVHTNGAHGNVEPWSDHNSFTRINEELINVINLWIEN